MSANTHTLTVQWNGGHGVEAPNPTGATARFGSLHELAALSAIELVQAGLAGFNGSEVVHVLAKKQQILSVLEIRVQGKRATGPRSACTSIQLEYLLRGSGRTERGVAEALSLSRHKCCSVAVMLDKTAEIQTSFRIRNEQGEDGPSGPEVA
ncbi:MAG: OsmC family protein [Anaerolineales bacterium]|jgi:putative redox protein